MAIQQLNIQHFRNLSDVSITPSTVGANIIQGKNGSGKSSLLEAIHFLGLGKSFRSHILGRIIQYEADSFSLFAQLIGEDKQTTPIGIERGRGGISRMRIAGKDAHSSAELAEVLPLQLLEPHSFELLEGGPSLRRSFLDWGVFHVEHIFLNLWRNFVRSVKQRNKLLKNGANKVEILSWDHEIINYGEQIDTLRRSYVEAFEAVFYPLLEELIHIPNLKSRYYSGWAEDKTLAEAMENGLSRDKMIGYTQFGPHHADLKMMIGKHPAKEVLSRGQQKLFVSAMKIAQGLLYQMHKKGSCIYLLDDLVAELDVTNQGKILALLAQQKSQFFITCTDDQEIGKKINEMDVKMFHVERGKIAECALS